MYIFHEMVPSATSVISIYTWCSLKHWRNRFHETSCNPVFRVAWFPFFQLLAPYADIGIKRQKGVETHILVFCIIRVSISHMFRVRGVDWLISCISRIKESHKICPTVTNIIDLHIFLSECFLLHEMKKMWILWYPCLFIKEQSV